MEKIAQDEREKIREEEMLPMVVMNLVKVSEELSDYYGGRHRSHTRSHS